MNGTLKAFFETGERATYKKGSLIFRADDEPRNVSLIMDGYVKVYTVNNTFEQYVHIVYGPSEIFPLSWLMGSYRPTIYYQALTECTVLHVPQADVLAQVQKDHKFSVQMLKQVLIQNAYYTARVDNLEYKFASERLAYRLLFLAARFGQRRSNGDIALGLPLTHQILGGSINLSRESVTREIDKLLRQEVLAYEGHTLILKDISKLTKHFKNPISSNWWGLINHHKVQ
jgi:CRP-like cAMP-binding protein